jgi:hypothetical protein
VRPVRRVIPAVVGALLVLPAGARATTQWFKEGTPITEGEIVEVASTGPKVALNLTRPKQPTIKIACPISGRENFRNSPAGGLGETQAISFACPEGTSVTPILPWTSTLLESELPPLHDQWENVTLDLTYRGVDYGRFTGSIDTTVGDVDPQKDREKFKRDELDAYLVFHGGVKKSLAGPNGAKLTISGFYRLGGKGSRVTDESGFWMTDAAEIPVRPRDLSAEALGDERLER